MSIATSQDSSKQATPCGAWTSPISAAVVAAGAVPLSQVMLDGPRLAWLEGRASEAGRTTLMLHDAGGTRELTPAPFNVRTRVHEYGGGACLLAGGDVFFSHHVDNRLYRVTGNSEPTALTHDGTRRFADFVLDRARQRLIAVREDHSSGATYPTNTLTAVGFDGVETVLVDGNDFYAAPRLSPDGRQLAWLCWDHPRMPWVGTELWLADVGDDGVLLNGRLIAGGPEESICQPEWSPGGVLHFVSDRSGWWNLYRYEHGVVHALCPREAEFGAPHWVFGGSLYGFRSDDEIICAYIENGVSYLGRLSTRDGSLLPIETAYEEIRDLRVQGDVIAFLGGAPTIAPELVRIDLMSDANEVLAHSIPQPPSTGYLAVPLAISYPSDSRHTGGRTAHAFYYAPTNADHEPAAGELPPLIVIGHGGPTGMAASTLKLSTQFWTSRGFAVLDVNYGGSTGFGRDYRNLLQGQWGVVDVEDCVAGARHLAQQGLVDPDRLLIRGSSAGGLTVLSSLAFHDVFKAGASYYGVSDLAGLDADSHKFESHYNQYLIAPPERAEAVYRERSPIHHSDKLRRPMIFFQGLDDKVVPPQQSESMVDALRARRLPVAYITLEGEGHGFRKADSVVRTLEAELVFYLRVFGIPVPSGLPAIEIENLEEQRGA
jgi:dipeptidyl aminopeptidase/acylaminoacyl peptidase